MIRKTYQLFWLNFLKFLYPWRKHTPLLTHDTLAGSLKGISILKKKNSLKLYLLTF